MSEVPSSNNNNNNESEVPSFLLLSEVPSSSNNNKESEVPSFLLLSEVPSSSNNNNESEVPSFLLLSEVPSSSNNNNESEVPSFLLLSEVPSSNNNNNESEVPSFLQETMSSNKKSYKDKVHDIYAQFPKDKKEIYKKDKNLITLTLKRFHGEKQKKNEQVLEYLTSKEFRHVFATFVLLVGVDITNDHVIRFMSNLGLNMKETFTKDSCMEVWIFVKQKISELTGRNG